MDEADCIGTACLALVEAVQSYKGSDEERRGIPFKTYVFRRVEWALAHAYHRMLPARVSWDTWRQLRNFVRNRAKALDEARRPLTDEELAERLGISVDRFRALRTMANALQDSLSLSAFIGHEVGEDDGSKESTPTDKLADEYDLESSVLDAVAAEQERAWLVQTIEKLPDLAKLGISLRFGLPVPSLARVPLGSVIDVSLHHQAVMRGLKKLREARRRERGDLPEVVQEQRGRAVVGSKVRKETSGEAEHRRLQQSWRLLASGERPPVLARLVQRSGAVRARERGGHLPGQGAA